MIENLQEKKLRYLVFIYDNLSVLSGKTNKTTKFTK